MIPHKICTLGMKEKEMEFLFFDIDPAVHYNLLKLVCPLLE